MTSSHVLKDQMTASTHVIFFSHSNNIRHRHKPQSLKKQQQQYFGIVKMIKMMSKKII